MAEFRVGLIGYGTWGQEAYAPAFRRDGRARIVSAAAHLVRGRDIALERRPMSAFQCDIASLREEETEVDVNGDDGDLIAHIFAGAMRWRSRSNPEWSIEQVPALEPRAGCPGMHEYVSAFLDALESGQPSSTNAEVIAELHLVGLAAQASKDSGT